MAWIETMSAPEEIQAACEAAEEVGIPYVFTASFDTAGKTMMGLAPGNMLSVVALLPHPPVAYGANCGVGASDLTVSALAMTEENPNAVIVGKANCGIPIVKGKETVYTGTPELMADYVKVAADSGVRIIGGCCGTAPLHIAAMRKAMDAYNAGPRPTQGEVVEKLGALVAPGTSDAGKARKAARDSRRRR